MYRVPWLLGGWFCVLASAFAEPPAAILQRALDELQPSSLSRAEQQAELEWFIAAARPLQGLQIRVIAERIATHEYEAFVLAPLFSELTGIRVIHEISGEDDVVNKLRAQQRTGLPLYDAFISDSDLLGQHFRDGQVLALTDFMAGQGAAFTLPYAEALHAWD